VLIEHVKASGKREFIRSGKKPEFRRVSLPAESLGDFRDEGEELICRSPEAWTPTLGTPIVPGTFPLKCPSATSPLSEKIQTGKTNFHYLHF
jgi:hypothetical protein